MINNFYEGSIVEFRYPNDGNTYDGIVWRILKEDETNYSLFIRFVDVLNDDVR